MKTIPHAIGCVWFAATFAALAAEDVAKPNVVFLLADDLGWGDLSCHSSALVQTPNLDRLAKQGTDFHQFNTTSPVCSPSRTGFMTGRFPARFGIRSAIGGVRKNAEVPQVDWLDPQAPMLPRLLKGAGYVTGHVGKWHCSQERLIPTWRRRSPMTRSGTRRLTFCSDIAAARFT
jgi:N-acetylgalactosamine-6-sulfatase